MDKQQFDSRQAEKERKRRAIMSNAGMNIWQKKHMLDNLDREYGGGNSMMPIQKTTDDNTKNPETKPIRKAVVKNPFTYLNRKRPSEDQENINRQTQSSTAASGGGGAPPEEEPTPEDQKDKMEKDSTKRNYGWLQLREKGPLFPTTADKPVIPIYPGMLRARTPNPIDTKISTINDGGPAFDTNDTPLKKAAREEARAYLDKLDMYYTSIPLRNLNTEMQDVTTFENYVDLGADAFGLVPDLAQGARDAWESLGGRPPRNLQEAAVFGGTAAASVLQNQGTSPDLPNIARLAGFSVQKDKDRIQAKIDYINSSDYKYLVDTYRSGDKFSKEISKEIDRVSKLSPIYGTKEENEEYKRAYISYLDNIIFMGKNPEFSYQQAKKELDRIDWEHKHKS